MAKEQCHTCGGMFEDSDLDDHLLSHLEDRTQQKEAQLKCPLCQGTDFDKETGSLQTSWGVRRHRVVMMICRTCRFIMQFHEGKTIYQWWGTHTLRGEETYLNKHGKVGEEEPTTRG